jgi:AcrR family transcriptional regulator
MTKAFTESRKEQVRQNLIEKGREFFVRYGLKKTSVDELVKATGIAKGTFYRFFESKEALFMAIHEESENKLQTDMLQKLEHLTDPDDILRTFFNDSFTLLEEDPLLRVFFDKGAFENLAGFLTTEQYTEHYRHDIAFLEDLLKKWQQEGIVRQIDFEAAANMIASVYYVTLQKETLDREQYINARNMLIDCIVNYLKLPDKEDNNER